MSTAKRTKHKVTKSRKPAQWRGNYQDCTGPNGTRLLWSKWMWIIRNNKGEIVSRHDSRAYAYAKARRLDASTQKKERK